MEEISQYIVESGGKRLRPLLVLLAARCCGYDERRACEARRHHRVSAHRYPPPRRRGRSQSVLRRGRATANATWGNAPSVLVGDFLYSRAFQLMVELGQMDIMAILSDATNTIAEGEVMQLANVGNCQVSEAEYMEVIRCKTALLFEASTHTAAVLGIPGWPRSGRACKQLRRAFRPRLPARRRLARLCGRVGVHGQERRR